MAIKYPQSTPMLFYSFSLFLVQVVIFTLLLLVYRPPMGIVDGICFFSGVVLGIWAIVSMKRSQLSALPYVVPGATLVKHGPYAFIRHPMYTSLLLISLGSVVNHISSVRVVMFVILFIVLLLKLSYEESLLLKEFSEYKTYKKRTKRLIPYLF